jgi:hypothetical protein
MEKCLKTLRFLNRHRDSILPLWKSKIITLRTKVSDISTRRGDWYLRIRWRDFTEVDLLEWTLVREELFSEFPSGIEFWILSVVERSFERRRRSLKGKLFNLYSAYSGGFLLRMKPGLVMSERELRGNYLFPGKSSLVKKLSVETFKEPFNFILKVPFSQWTRYKTSFLPKPRFIGGIAKSLDPKSVFRLIKVKKRKPKKPVRPRGYRDKGNLASQDSVARRKASEEAEKIRMFLWKVQRRYAYNQRRFTDPVKARRQTLREVKKILNMHPKTTLVAVEQHLRNLRGRLRG